MSDNGDKSKKAKLVLTFEEPEHCKVLIDMENMPGPSTAMTMLDIAKREFEFQWNMQRMAMEQAKAMAQAQVQGLIRKH